MNFEKYKNTLEYPVSKPKPPKQLLSSDPDLVKLYVREIKDYEARMRDYERSMEAYHNRERKIHDQFKQDMFEELGVTDNPKKDLLFSKAWEMGHSYGFSEVFHYAEELVDLIK